MESFAIRFKKTKSCQMLQRQLFQKVSLSINFVTDKWHTSYLAIHAINCLCPCKLQYRLVTISLQSKNKLLILNTSALSNNYTIFTPNKGLKIHIPAINLPHFLSVRLQFAFSISSVLLLVYKYLVPAYIFLLVLPSLLHVLNTSFDNVF